MKKLLFIFAFFNFTAHAGLKYSVGTDLFQIQYKEQRYKFDDYDAFKNPNKNITRIAWGVSYKPFEDKHIYLGLRTNRGINYETSTTAFDTVAKQNVNVKTKLVSDSIYLATAIHKNIIPYIIATKIDTKTTIFYNNGLRVYSNKNSILHGFGVAVPFMEKHSVAFTYFFSDRKYNAKRTFGVSYSYYLI